MLVSGFQNFSQLPTYGREKKNHWGQSGLFFPASMFASFLSAFEHYASFLWLNNMGLSRLRREPFPKMRHGAFHVERLFIIVEHRIGWEGVKDLKVLASTFNKKLGSAEECLLWHIRQFPKAFLFSILNVIFPAALQKWSNGCHDQFPHILKNLLRTFVKEAGGMHGFPTSLLFYSHFVQIAKYLV